MGLISRVSSRTYRESKILIFDQKQTKMVNAVSSHSRSAVYARKLVHQRKRWTTSAERKSANKDAKAVRPQKSYPTDDVRRRKKVNGAGADYRATQKLKSGIVPGSILILVAGRHRGKRVVFLKQLESGLLLVTGPFKINGVPLRRVNQKYVIATSTKLDFQSSIPERVCDDYFSRIELNAHEGQNEGEIFQTKKAVYQASAKRKEDQKAVDAAVLAAAKKVPYMVSYLASNFSLQNGQNPATMKF